MEKKKPFKTKLNIETLKANSFITSVDNIHQVQTGNAPTILVRCIHSINFKTELCQTSFCNK